MIGAHALTNAAGITYRQLDHWTRVGYLQPFDHGDGLGGSGYPREYPDSQIAVARFMGQLTRAGVHPTKAIVAVHQLIADGHADLGDFTLTPNQHDVQSDQQQEAQPA